MRKELKIGTTPPRKVLAAMGRIIRAEGGVDYHLDAATERARISSSRATHDPGEAGTGRAIDILTQVLSRTRALNEHV